MKKENKMKPQRTQRGDKILLCNINNISIFSVSAQADLPQA